MPCNTCRQAPKPLHPPHSTWRLLPTIVWGKNKLTRRLQNGQCCSVPGQPLTFRQPSQLGVVLACKRKKTEHEEKAREKRQRSKFLACKFKIQSSFGSPPRLRAEERSRLCVPKTRTWKPAQGAHSKPSERGGGACRLPTTCALG